MRPDERELDDEIRGHLALSIQEHIDRGVDPAVARQRALQELGYVGDVRASMRRVWYGRCFDAAAALARDLRFAFRSLRRAKGLSLTVIATLALGIGANAAIFSVVRGVLLKPLVNRGEDRLVYIRQSAPGIGADNTTFSVPEIEELKARVKTIAQFGDFSTVEFTLIGAGPDPALIKAGVVSGSFFDVMGLRPVLGRLLNAGDDGPKAAGVAVLTYRFWTSAFNRDPGVVGRAIRLSGRPATIVGVLEPSVPYPADTEIIANVVTSPHHLGATMTTNWTHRMTELFGRMAPGATLDEARAELTAAHAAMMQAHPDAYSTRAHVQVAVRTLRDQIAGRARTVLPILLLAAGLVFIIACSNVANLILARSIRREGELAVRAALGAGPRALRRTLLAESLVLCGAGAVFGVALSGQFVTLVAKYAARFSVRALDVTVDQSVLWVGAGLALAASVLLAYVPRLPSSQAPGGLGLSSAMRLTPGTSRRLRAFATVQIAFSFVLLVGAGMLLATLIALQTARTGIDMQHVVVFDVPPSIQAAGQPATMAFFQRLTDRVSQLPGVVAVSMGSTVPWRDANSMPRMQFTVDGYKPADGEENPHARFRIVAPHFFAVLGVPLIAGREFNDEDRAGNEPVAIVSQTLARRLFPNGDAVNRHLRWTDPLAAMMGAPKARRIIGVVADVDDENVVPGPTMVVYQPVRQVGYAGRLFVHAAGEPQALIPAVARIVRELAPEQPVERPGTLADVRAEILSPERLNAFVFSGFAGMALLIAVVGIAGVLAFSVSARTREFGVRLAVGSAPRQLLGRVLSEGVFIATTGIAVGAGAGYGVARVAARALDHVQLPDATITAGAAIVLIAAASVAALLPAARAARVDVVQALRAE